MDEHKVLALFTLSQLITIRMIFVLTFSLFMMCSLLSKCVEVLDKKFFPVY